LNLDKTPKVDTTPIATTALEFVAGSSSRGRERKPTKLSGDFVAATKRKSVAGDETAHDKKRSKITQPGAPSPKTTAAMEDAKMLTNLFSNDFVVNIDLRLSLTQHNSFKEEKPNTSDEHLLSTGNIANNGANELSIETKMEIESEPNESTEPSPSMAAIRSKRTPKPKKIYESILITKHCVSTSF
jgi:hypothetical protein